MTSHIRSPLAFVLTLCGTAYAAPANLLVNGSFEQGALGIGSFQGWQTSLGDPSTFVDSSGQTGLNYGQSSDGKWAAYFGSTFASGGSSISQTLVTTAGQYYNFAFDLANDNGGLAASNSFVAYINGVSIFSTTNLSSQGFLHEQFLFQASGSSIGVRFSAFNDQSYAELDNVSVQSATPEPSAFVLLATGLLACAGMSRASRHRSFTRMS